MTLPAASSEVSGPAGPPSVYAGGLRKPSSSEMSLLRAVRVRAGDRLGQHRVPEAVDRVGELGLDRRVELRLGERERLERVDRRLDLAGELLEHEVLVLHLGDEPGGLEEALAVPAVGAGRQLPLGQGRHAASGGVVGQHVLDVVDQAVVLGVEDLVDRGQADVLVDTAVTGDEVRVEHLVVVGAGRLGGEVGRGRVVGVRGRRHGGRARVVVGVLRSGRRCARCRSGTACRSAARWPAPAPGLAGLPSTRPVVRDVLRQAAQRAGDELAVRVGGEHRDVQ